MFQERTFAKFRSRIRKSAHFRHVLALKRARHEGLIRAATRYRLWSRILKSAPVHTESTSDSTEIELHTLCYWRDYLCAMWALKSFYRFSGARYPLVIHIQGFATPLMLRRMRKHFPDARIVTEAEADPLVERWLAERDLHQLLVRRKQNPFILRLCDFFITCRTPYLMMFDSDVLFFDRPAELLAPAQSHTAFVFMRDFSSGYTISPETAREIFGIDMEPLLNAGIAVIKRGAVDLGRCNELLATDAIGNGEPSFQDQTLYALIASESKQLQYLPSTYVLSLEAGRSFNGITARHYAGDSRPLMTSEGMPYLIERGLLEFPTR
jgi:hypothetical protein